MLGIVKRKSGIPIFTHQLIDNYFACIDTKILQKSFDSTSVTLFASHSSASNLF